MLKLKTCFDPSSVKKINLERKKQQFTNQLLFSNETLFPHPKGFGSKRLSITQTCLCNILQFLTAVKMVIFRLKIVIFSFYSKHRLWVHDRTADKNCVVFFFLITFAQTLSVANEYGSNEYPRTLF